MTSFLFLPNLNANTNWSASFFLNGAHYSTLQMRYDFSNLSSADEHFGCFHNAILSPLIQMPSCTCAQTSEKKAQRREIAQSTYVWF